VELVAAAAFAWIIYIGASSEMGVGDFVAFMSALNLMMRPARTLTRINEPIQTGIAAAESIFGFIDQHGEAETGSRKLQNVRGEIEYQDVNFRYDPDGKNVLHQVSFHIEAGQTVALVGPSGSGKSTVVSLLARFYNPQSGSIRIDGQDIAGATLDSLRRSIALVTQDTVLFNDTIANNIAYGHKGRVPKKRLHAAAEAARVLEFTDRFEQGLDTAVGESGTRLSGGQRQRIAIARALFKDAPILLLDEATSSLDADSEQQVQAALGELLQHRTTLVIAHRLSTIENADRILVLRRGHIVESGSHKELIGRKDGAYERLYRTQFAGQKTSPT
jgi:subfamily B ATP-binding cassette protein MsbA